MMKNSDRGKYVNTAWSTVFPGSESQISTKAFLALVSTPAAISVWIFFTDCVLIFGSGKNQNTALRTQVFEKCPASFLVGWRWCMDVDSENIQKHPVLSITGDSWNICVSSLWNCPLGLPLGFSYTSWLWLMMSMFDIGKSHVSSDYFSSY